MKKFSKILAVCLLVVMVAMTFTSCGLFSLNLEKVTGRLMDKGYSIYAMSDEDELKYITEALDIEEPKILYSASKDDERFLAVEFEKASDAKDAFDALEEHVKDMGEDTICKRQGKVVYGGTEQALKDALGFPANLFLSFDLGNIFGGLFGNDEKEYTLDLDKAEDYLEDNDYDVYSMEYDGDEMLSAEKDNQYFFACEFESADEADEAYAELESDWYEMEQEAEYEGLEVDYGRQGNIIYYGTVDAIDIAFGKK